MFQVGDTVVHPGYGAGVVTEIKELAILGDNKKKYYSIRLLSQPQTDVIVTVKNEDKVGLRSPISQSKLKKVWHVLQSDPSQLPSDHKKRYAMLKERLYQGDIFEVTKVLRDLAWRREEKKNLTMRGKRLYQASLELLASEVAGAQSGDFDRAEIQIETALADSITEAEM